MSTSTSTRIAAGVTATYLVDLSRHPAPPAQRDARARERRRRRTSGAARRSRRRLARA